MYRRVYEDDPPLYRVHFKIHYKVNQGEAVYMNIYKRANY